MRHLTEFGSMTSHFPEALVGPVIESLLTHKVYKADNGLWRYWMGTNTVDVGEQSVKL